jgi:hypothetical protein
MCHFLSVCYFSANPQSSGPTGSQLPTASTSALGISSQNSYQMPVNLVSQAIQTEPGLYNPLVWKGLVFDVLFKVRVKLVKILDKRGKF